jgi:predicted DNA-binding protein with PD1-like motif
MNYQKINRQNYIIRLARGKEIIIHAHASFADKNMHPLAGHLVEAKISGTAEIFLTKTKKLEKFYDQKTGFKLFSFKNFL